MLLRPCGNLRVSVSDQQPSVSFVIPTLNGGDLLVRCLESIRKQDYPTDKIEILIVDGGSTDGTQNVAQKFGAIVVPNEKVLAEPGIVLGLTQAKGNIRFLMAADNGLPVPNWIRQMVRPFVEDPSVMGAFTQIVPSELDNAITRYYCHLHVEPFTWFVYGAACNPRDFHKVYKTLEEKDGYVIYQFTPKNHPLIAFAQGFAVRKEWVRKPEYEDDDILPFIQMIEEGRKIAYVPNAGIYHHHLKGFSHYLKKYQWRIRNSLNQTNFGFDRRAKYLTFSRKARKFLWVIYGNTLIGPVLDSFRFGFWHIPASVGLSYLITYEVIRKAFFSFLPAQRAS